MTATVLDRLRHLPSVQVTLALALFVLGFLVAAQIAAEGPRVRYTTEERAPLIDTALGLQAQQDALKADVVRLRARISELEAQDPGAAESLKQLYRELEEARLSAGLLAVTGPGVAFRLEDAAAPGGVGRVTARDVRILVEELWLAGADGVAVNGERVTVATAVLDIGGSLLVNSAYLAPPYTIAAIGPRDLYARMQRSASFVEFVTGRVQPAGLELSVAELASVDLPAYAGTVAMRFARPAATAGTTR